MEYFEDKQFLYMTQDHFAKNQNFFYRKVTINPIINGRPPQNVFYLHLCTPSG
jgi:hypothetical protein